MRGPLPGLASVPRQCASRCLPFLLVSGLATTVAAARPAQPFQEDLKRLSVEQLMQIDVTTAGRREEPVGTTAAAISVITGEDIRRSGVTTIADAIGLADAVHVARFNNGTWSISARGFNANTANKLLVMVDGRTVYSPLFSGVFWNSLDYVLADIDRIEVIRGPGGTLWGSNAVNGVINIITRHARETAGTYATLSAGTEDRMIAEVRYGSAGAAAWRLYGRMADRDGQVLATGADDGGARRHGQAGFRVDGVAGDAASWMLKGDVFHGSNGFADRPDGEFSHVDLQGRWSARSGASSRLTVQSYYQREYRRVPRQLTHRVDSVDVDAQHDISLRRHDIVWGGGARASWDRAHGSAVFRMEPEARTYRVSNVFVQDDIALVPGLLFATVGAKWEHNTFSGGELQPSVRARLQMSSRQMLWGGVSRVTRSPTRFEVDVFVPGPPAIAGSDGFVPESLVAVEAGYRVQPSAIFSIEVAAFRHRISDLRSIEAAAAPGEPLTVGNSLVGRAHGIETGFNVQPRGWWRTHVGYTWLDTSIERAPGSRDLFGGINEANDPGHLFSLSSSIDLPRGLEVDMLVRSVGSLPRPPVPAYTELRLRGGWHATPRLELWAVGDDLLHDRHPEFAVPGAVPIEFERAVRAGVTVRY
jgi:iron complex outermembrane receptor protein